jgi:murein DD-endopeptidase / murein LD-carboxypeptidase
MTIDYAERARALVGVRFRPQGRGSDGLDCVGVVVETFALDRLGVRQNYSLRGDHREEIEARLREDFRRVPLRQMQPGDVMLMSLGRQQMHLGVRTDAGFVHAHAGIRRVIETPGVPEWPLVAAYRRRSR